MPSRPPIVLRRAAGGVPRQAAPSVLGALAAIALYLVVGVLPLLWLYLALQDRAVVLWAPHCFALCAACLLCHSIAFGRLLHRDGPIKSTALVGGLAFIIAFLFVDARTAPFHAASSAAPPAPAASLSVRDSVNMGPSCRLYERARLPSFCSASVANAANSTASPYFVGALGGGPFAAALQGARMSQIAAMFKRWNTAASLAPSWRFYQFTPACVAALLEFSCALIVPPCDAQCVIQAPCASTCFNTLTACPALASLLGQLQLGGEVYNMFANLVAEPFELELISLLAHSLKASCQVSWLPVPNPQFPNASIDSACAAATTTGATTAWPGFGDLANWSPALVHPLNRDIPDSYRAGLQAAPVRQAARELGAVSCALPTTLPASPVETVSNISATIPTVVPSTATVDELFSSRVPTNFALFAVAVAVCVTVAATALYYAALLAQHVAHQIQLAGGDSFAARLSNYAFSTRVTSLVAPPDAAAAASAVPLRARQRRAAALAAAPAAQPANASPLSQLAFFSLTWFDAPWYFQLWHSLTVLVLCAHVWALVVFVDLLLPSTTTTVATATQLVASSALLGVALVAVYHAASILLPIAVASPVADTDATSRAPAPVLRGGPGAVSAAGSAPPRRPGDSARAAEPRAEVSAATKYLRRWTLLASQVVAMGTAVFDASGLHSLGRAMACVELAGFWLMYNYAFLAPALVTHSWNLVWIFALLSINIVASPVLLLLSPELPSLAFWACSFVFDLGFVGFVALFDPPTLQNTSSCVTIAVALLSQQRRLHFASRHPTLGLLLARFASALRRAATAVRGFCTDASASGQYHSIGIEDPARAAESALSGALAIQRPRFGARQLQLLRLGEALSRHAAVATPALGTSSVQYQSISTGSSSSDQGVPLADAPITASDPSPALSPLNPRRIRASVRSRPSLASSSGLFVGHASTAFAASASAMPASASASASILTPHHTITAQRLVGRLSLPKDADADVEMTSSNRYASDSESDVSRDSTFRERSAQLGDLESQAATAGVSRVLQRHADFSVGYSSAVSALGGKHEASATTADTARPAAHLHSARLPGGVEAKSSHPPQTIFYLMRNFPAQPAQDNAGAPEALPAPAETAVSYIPTPRDPELRPFHPTRDLSIELPMSNFHRRSAPVPASASAAAAPEEPLAGVSRAISALKEYLAITVPVCGQTHENLTRGSVLVLAFCCIPALIFFPFFIGSLLWLDENCARKLEPAADIWRHSHPRVYFSGGFFSPACGFPMVETIAASGLGLVSLPDALFSTFSGVRVANFSGNQLTRVPASLNDGAAALEILVFSYNRIEHVSPLALLRAPLLGEFDVRENPVAMNLDWSGLNLTALPPKLQLFANAIQVLNLSSNAIGTAVDPIAARALAVSGRGNDLDRAQHSPSLLRVQGGMHAQASASMEWCRLGLDGCQSVQSQQNPNQWLNVLVGFKRLRILDASRNSLRWDANSNAHLTRLIKNLPVALPALEQLDLSDNEITSFKLLLLSSVVSFPLLSVLAPSEDYLNGAKAKFKWPLMRLDLRSNRISELSCGSHFEPWLTRTHVDMTNNPVTQTWCSGFPWHGPSTLVLNTQLLLQSKSMRVFGLRGRHIESAAMSTLLASLPGVQYLILDDCALERIPAGVASMGRLSMLMLENNPLSESGLDELPAIASIYLLSTANTYFSALPPDFCSRVSNLRRLQLQLHRLRDMPDLLSPLFWAGGLHSLEVTAAGSGAGSTWYRDSSTSGLLARVSASLGVPCHSAGARILCGSQCPATARPGTIFLTDAASAALLVNVTSAASNSSGSDRQLLLAGLGMLPEHDPLLLFPTRRWVADASSLGNASLFDMVPPRMLEQILYRPRFTPAAVSSGTFGSAVDRFATDFGAESLLMDDVPRTFQTYVNQATGGVLSHDGFATGVLFPNRIVDKWPWYTSTANFFGVAMREGILDQIWRADGAVRLYAGALNCRWLINAPVGRRIQLRLLSMHVSSSQPDPTDPNPGIAGNAVLCPNDYIQIFDGSTADAPSLLPSGDRLCGTGGEMALSIPSRFISTAEQVLVLFFADAFTSSQGFELQYSLL